MQEHAKYIYLAVDTDLTSQDKYIFNFIHLEQEEGWQLDRAAIITHTNSFNTQ